MTDGYEIISVDSDNIARTGFFCYMSKPKSPGYHQKREWLKARFAEGMKLKILHEHGYRDVGFIEYLPGEYAWRTVQAPGYLVIHCLWVVGKGKGKGYGTRLLQECLEDAQAQNKSGVVMVTSDSVWLAGKEIFLRNGFEEVDQAPPSFRLLVHRFGSAPEPAFPHDWEARLQMALREHPRQLLKSLVARWWPASLAEVLLEVHNVPPEVMANQVTKVHRRQTAELLNEFTLHLKKARPLETAMVTAGGVAVSEIEPQTMESRKMPGLYFAGEILDIDGISGGYNLQGAYSTGFVAGRAAAG